MRLSACARNFDFVAEDLVACTCHRCSNEKHYAAMRHCVLTSSLLGAVDKGVPMCTTSTAVVPS